MSIMFDVGSRERREERCYFCGLVLPNRCYGFDVDGTLQLICADCFRAASALDYLSHVVSKEKFIDYLGMDTDTLLSLQSLYELREAGKIAGDE